MVRFTIDSDSGQFILFDEVEKLKVIITIEAVQAFGNKYTLDEDGIKKFYNEYRNRKIATIMACIGTRRIIKPIDMVCR